MNHNSSSSKSEPNDQKEYSLPNGDKISIDELVSLYKEQNVPVPVAVEINANHQNTHSIQVKWSIDDYERKEAVSFSKSVLIDVDEKSSEVCNIKELAHITDVSNELASVISPSGQYRVSVSKLIGKENNSKNNATSNQILDLWDLKTNTLQKSIKVDSTNHGAIVLNQTFSRISFSPNEKQLLYVAEVKNKSESFFKDTDLSKDSNTEKEKDHKSISGRGDEYLLRQDWGEQLAVIHSCICVLTLTPQLEIKVIDLPNLSLASPFWIDDFNIGFVALRETPQRIGKIFCFNRVALLFTCDLKSDEKSNTRVVRGENNDLHLMHPRINKQKTKVVWFENVAGGAHNQASCLMLWNLKKNTITKVFDKYERDQLLIKSLFICDVPYDCWALDGEHIFLTIENHSRQLSVCLNLEKKTIQVIDCGLESSRILGFENNLIVIAASSPDHRPVVKVAYVKSTGEVSQLKQLNKEQCSKNSEINYRLIKQNEENELTQLETILISSSKKCDQLAPIIVFPHGGPHGASVLAYNKTLCFFARLGFKIALTNYRGSTGITSDYTDQLCSNVGDMDVQDIFSAINNLIDMKLIDKNNIHLMGGSHGGFLVTHLIGQYPDVFASCIARNPVCDMSKMFASTDIPDWCLVETFGLNIETFQRLNSWPEEKNLVNQLNRLVNVGNPKVMAAMFEKSPMKYIDQVKTPVLMMLGSLDKRVPHHTGLAFYQALKVRGVEAKCYLYEDNHSIGKFLNNCDMSINSAIWLLDHLRH